MMKLSLSSPTKTFLREKEVSKVFLPTEDGPLMMLEKRAPLFQSVGEGMLSVSFADGKTQEYLIGKGVAEMREGRLSVTTDWAFEKETAESFIDEAVKGIHRYAEKMTDSDVRDFFHQEEESLQQLLSHKK